MNYRRYRISDWLIFTGSGLLGVGVLLGLIQLVIFLSWHALWIVLAGFVMLTVGTILRSIKG